MFEHLVEGEVVVAEWREAAAEWRGVV